MSTTYIEELEEQLKQAQKAATPVIVETIKHDQDEKVSVSSHGTTRRDVLGGSPQQVLGKAEPVVEKRLVDVPWNKDNGRLLKDTETEREAKLKSGTIRTDLK